MFKRFVLACALVAPDSQLADAPGKTPARTLTGTIRKFECGDNRYLTLATRDGEQTGLCEARPCIPWFEQQEMPKKHIGRRVRVTTGMGKRFDTNYDVVGHTLSFGTLTFEK